jgi:CheY-like chemotaxis protein
MTRGQAIGRILLVEDDSGIREVLAEILREAGYEVATATNGRDALDRLREASTPDLIVLDLRMPTMDGLEFLAIQKEHPTLERVPVVAVSAGMSASTEAVVVRAYLKKPFSAASLLDTIQRVIGDVKP